MRSNRCVLILSALMVVALLVALNSSSRGQAQPGASPISPRVVWEYKTIFGTMGATNDRNLNALGREGWKLFSVNDAPSGQMAYVFERARQGF